MRGMSTHANRERVQRVRARGYVLSTDVCTLDQSMYTTAQLDTVHHY